VVVFPIKRTETHRPFCRGRSINVNDNVAESEENSKETHRGRSKIRKRLEYFFTRTIPRAFRPQAVTFWCSWAPARTQSTAVENKKPREIHSSVRPRDPAIAYRQLRTRNVAFDHNEAFFSSPSFFVRFRINYAISIVNIHTVVFAVHETLILQAFRPTDKGLGRRVWYWHDMIWRRAHLYVSRA